MQIQAQYHSLPKAGNSEVENEDAGWIGPLVEAEPQIWRCAVADGATETSFSRLWARMLVRAFGRGWLPYAALASSLPALQHRWLRLVTRRPLPWYAEQKIEEGAHAAFVGLEFTPDNEIGLPNGGAWRAWALGDACVFQVPVGGWELTTAFPILCAGDFGSRPHLLSSRTEHNARTLLHVRHQEGTWQSGDVFYLLTDALAAWFLHQVEERWHPWMVLDDQIQNSASFAEWVDLQRRAAVLRNDDVTVIRVSTK